MRAPSSNRPRSTAANMTPMIDVVFLLIIFFLVSSHLARQENHLPVDLPIAATHGPLDLAKAALTITVDDQSQLRVAGDVVKLAGLRSAMAKWVQREGRTAAIRIRVDGGVPYSSVEPVLREAALVGITDAAIAVREESAK